MTYDMLIKNGLVVDGTGRPARRADVAVTGGTIAEIGRVTEGAAAVLDARDLVGPRGRPRGAPCRRLAACRREPPPSSTPATSWSRRGLSIRTPTTMRRSAGTAPCLRRRGTGSPPSSWE